MAGNFIFLPLLFVLFGNASPFSMNPDDIKFWNFQTNENQAEIKYGDPASIGTSGFRTGSPVVFIIHGGNTNTFDFFADEYVRRMRREYLQQGRSNVIGVDYSALVSIDQNPWGPVQVVGEIAINVITTGRRLAECINFLRQNGAIQNFDSVHLVGWSLGGQVAGIAGAELKKLSNSVPGRISALDPMGLTFGERIRQADQRLDKGDAVFVDVTYTSSSNSLTPIGPVGHANFYPNADNGRGNNMNFWNQPGCPFNIADLVGTFWCAHAKGYQYFADSINGPAVFACKCKDTSLSDCKGNIASCPSSVVFGENVPFGTNGIFYFRTG